MFHMMYERGRIGSIKSNTMYKSILYKINFFRTFENKLLFTTQQFTYRLIFLGYLSYNHGFTLKI